MSRIYVKPGDGLKVKKPDRTWVPEAGEWLEHDVFVQRRLTTGDLVLAEAPKDAAPAAAKPAAAEGART